MTYDIDRPLASTRECTDKHVTIPTHTHREIKEEMGWGWGSKEQVQLVDNCQNTLNASHYAEAKHLFRVILVCVCITTRSKENGFA